jgi:hypothetical protein
VADEVDEIVILVLELGGCNLGRNSGLRLGA